MLKRICSVVASAVLCMTAAAVGEPQAESDEDLQTTIRALKMQLREQQQRLGNLEKSQQRQEQLQRENILEVLKDMEADAAGRSTVPSWLDDLKFGGDLRLRFQTDDRGGDKDRHRARFRLRFGVEKNWLDGQLTTGFRLATGSADSDDWDEIGGSDPTSSNQTFDGLFSQKPIWVDRAYATYKPKAIKGLMLTAGKISNPLRTSSLFIDSDVNPEGAWGQYTYGELGSFAPFAGAGFFVVEESSGSDAVLMAYSAGFDWELVEDVKWSMAANVWDYDNYDTHVVSNRGNTDIAWNLDFLVLNIHNQMKFKAFNLPVALYFDWAHNCREGEKASAYAGEDNAYHAGVKVGANKKKGDWSAKYEYGWIEANAIPGFWADGDFGRANRRGHIIKGAYNLTDFMTAGLALFCTERIRSTDGDDDAFTLQADLVWKF
ncbi:MAG: putative porin [Phycisphaerae bacterium]